MELAFKQRMVGAVFILSLGVILIPVLFDTPHIDAKTEVKKPHTPAMPDVASVNQINYVFNDLESNFARADSAPPIDVSSEHKAEAEEIPPSEPMVKAEALASRVEPESPPQASSQAEAQDNDEVIPDQPKPLTPPPTVRTTVALNSGSAKTIAEKWTIQLGAFSSRQNASVLLKKLSQQGFESYLKDDKSRKLVRVFVAPGVNHDNAQLLLGRLDKELGIKGMIVRFNDN